ncbi:hypothetical protein BDA96_09G128700 [Sorghum bicolor]|uniref:Rx N-terminal domain-containing protein n=1 Tax=Sorghum bicolor TaxID=4558 RepID=A0A921U4K8_SORBI|nr:hypothetical protein BDA96_09G128700 [Sorghum bicolor]
MAEQAVTAVSSLLSIISSEARLLGGVRDDVRYIKEEMESMAGFLEYLARTAPPGGKHDELVSTWMHQVRLLAQDCRDCVGLYLYRRDPEIHRVRGHFWWLFWLPHKMAAQHHAAIQLRRLKDRAREVSDRRLRYGATMMPRQVALAAAEASSSSASGSGGYAGDEDDDDDDGGDNHTTASDHSRRRRSGCFLLEPPTLDDYFQEKLREWIHKVTEEEIDDAVSLAHQTLVVPGTYYHRSISVDIPAVHIKFTPLRPKDILYYILWELQHAKPQSQTQQLQGTGREERHLDWLDDGYRRLEIMDRKKRLLGEIKTRIARMKVYQKLEKIEKGIREGQPMNKGVDQLEDLKNLELEVLLPLLHQSAAAVAQQGHVRNKVMNKLAASYGNIITETANKLKRLMEVEGAVTVQQQTHPICLEDSRYELILLDVFPVTSSSKPLQTKEATKTTTKTLSEHQIKEMIHEAKQEILRELQKGKYDKNQATEYDVEEIVHKIEIINRELKEQLIQDIVNRIKDHLKDETPLIILKIDDREMDGSTWKETTNALNLLQCDADALIIMNTKNIQQAKEYCYPRQEPIYYTLAGLYQDTVLKLTSQQKDGDYYKKSQVLRDILDECEPYELCMKIFTHALYAKPKRSNEELHKLHSALKVSPKSLQRVAKKMFKFSYNDLPKEHRSCLLYLAIFPQGHKIRRSTLIDVHQAERCFDMLIDRWLLYPCDISASGKVKSCMVGDLVHGFITKIARKQHIVETRLSHHLAHHFSIFNDIELRGSDKIDTFLQSISKSSKWSMLKVLDIEGFQYLKENNYLKGICSNILLLKYLSLREQMLPKLEVLDIRQTMIPASATKYLVLLKLKRLLAGTNVLSNVKASPIGRELIDIGNLWKLQKLGVVVEDKDRPLRNLLRAISDLHECLLSLSITLPTTGYDGTPSHEELPASPLRLRYPPKLLESLSISGTTNKGRLLPLLAKDLHHQLAKVTLSSTSLNQEDLKVLAKLTMLLCLKLENIACTESMLTFKKNEFQNLNYFVLQGSSLTEILFEEGATPELKKIILSLTNIEYVSGVKGLTKLEELVFNNNRTNSSGYIAGASRYTYPRQETKYPQPRALGQNMLWKRSTPYLQKIVWTYTNMQSLSGINKLPKLKDLEFNGGAVPVEVEEAINKLKERTHFDFKHNKLKNQEQAKGYATEEEEDDDDYDDARFPFCWKKKV